MSAYDDYQLYQARQQAQSLMNAVGIYDSGLMQGYPTTAGYSSVHAAYPQTDKFIKPPAAQYHALASAFDKPKEEEVALTKEQRPQGWKAGLVVVAAFIIAFNLWKNRDEIFVKLESLASDLGNKLGIGDIPGLTAPKDDKK